MPRDPKSNVFLGIKGAVIALEQRAGNEVWRAELKSSEFVTVLWDGEALFAATSGEIWRLDPESGIVIWHNQLKGLGRGLVSLASNRVGSQTGNAELAAEKQRRDAAAAAAAAAS
jgi:outer membrane protein assembly factor BamB